MNTNRVLLFLGIALLLFTGFIILLILSVHLQNESEKNVGQFTETSKLLLESINQSADPCVDFYEYACGNWPAAHNISNGQLKDDFRMTVHDVQKEKVEAKVCHLLEEAHNQSISTNTLSSVEVQFYQKCLQLEKSRNQKNVDRQASPLSDFLERLLAQPWPVKKSNFTKIHFGKDQLELLFVELILLQMEPLFSVSFQPILGTIVFTPPSSFLLFNKKLNLSDEVRNFEVRQFMHMDLRASLLSMSLGEITNQTGALVNWTSFVNRLLEGSMKRFVTLVDGPDADGLHVASLVQRSEKLLELIRQLAVGSDASQLNSTRVQRLKQFVDHPMLHLLKHSTGKHSIRFFTDSDVVHVQDLKYFEHIAKLLVKPSIELINYLGWKVVDRFHQYTNDQLLNDTIKPTNGTSEIQYKKHCALETLKLYSAQVIHRYLRQSAANETKHMAIDMVARIKEAFAQALKQSDWMDASTQQQAMDKLYSMQAQVSHPNWQMFEYVWMKGAVVQKNKTTFEMALEKLNFDQSLFWITWNMKAQCKDNATWLFDNFLMVNAMYSLRFNILGIPHGYLQDPLFHPSFPDSYNYGTIGFAISHEIAHGFSGEQSYAFDSFKKSKHRPWWTSESKAHFVEKSQCFLKQYSAMEEPVTKQKLNGSRTIGEDIADNVGIRLAYTAFHQLLYPSTVLLSNFTADQLFFLGYAQEFCHLASKKEMERFLEVDTHSTARFRVNIPLGNFDRFSVAFSCPAGSIMNPKDKCILW